MIQITIELSEEQYNDLDIDLINSNIIDDTDSKDLCKPEVIKSFLAFQLFCISANSKDGIYSRNVTIKRYCDHCINGLQEL